MYLFDANVFIEAKNRYYAFDICPGFWEWMDFIVTRGEVFSIGMVCDELAKGNDELAEWAKTRKGADWFLDVSDQATQKAFAAIAAGVQGEPFKDAAKMKFLSGADPWLVAKAVNLGATVVTHETHDALAKKRVPLPNICEKWNVSFTNSFEVLRKLSASFVLE
jgi:predicted nucleic acid-binding protein